MKGNNLICKKKQSFGFTLVEILVVLVIIGILTTLVANAFQATRKSARDSKRKSDLAVIQAALEQYRSDNGRYPNKPPDAGDPWGGWLTMASWDWNDCTISSNYLCKALVEGGYLDKLPIDPGANGPRNGVWEPSPCGNYEAYVYRATEYGPKGEYYLFVMEESKNGAGCLSYNPGGWPPTCETMNPGFWSPMHICLKNP